MLGPLTHNLKYLGYKRNRHFLMKTFKTVLVAFSRRVTTRGGNRVPGQGTRPTNTETLNQSTGTISDYTLLSALPKKYAM